MSNTYKETEKSGEVHPNAHHRSKKERKKSKKKEKNHHKHHRNQFFLNSFLNTQTHSQLTTKERQPEAKQGNTEKRFAHHFISKNTTTKKILAREALKSGENASQN